MTLEVRDMSDEAMALLIGWSLDELLAYRAFLHDGGDPSAIFAVERAFLGEVVDPREVRTEVHG